MSLPSDVSNVILSHPLVFEYAFTFLRLDFSSNLRTFSNSLLLRVELNDPVARNFFRNSPPFFLQYCSIVTTSAGLCPFGNTINFSGAIVLNGSSFFGSPSPVPFKCRSNHPSIVERSSGQYP